MQESNERITSGAKDLLDKVPCHIEQQCFCWVSEELRNSLLTMCSRICAFVHQVDGWASVLHHISETERHPKEVRQYGMEMEGLYD